MLKWCKYLFNSYTPKLDGSCIRLATSIPGDFLFYALEDAVDTRSKRVLETAVRKNTHFDIFFRNARQRGRLLYEIEQKNQKMSTVAPDEASHRYTTEARKHPEDIQNQ